MSIGEIKPSPAVRILVVRLGAMGDIVHTLPAVASLKRSFPDSQVTWAVEPKWTPLLVDNPFVDLVIAVERKSLGGVLRSVRALREDRFDFAVDFQGLIKSSLVAAIAGADRIFGFDRSQTREKPAALLYSDSVMASATHVVDRNLELARAAGASIQVRVFPLPAGEAEQPLPDGDFVLASPLAGWASKQWPIEFYSRLAERLRRELGISLVVNGPPSSADILSQIEGAHKHLTGIAGLIYATRRASAVVGVDSGPLHIAVALEKPGVAIFGPTDPARNGPYGNSLQVLRSSVAETSYKRLSNIDASMRTITPDNVFDALRPVAHLQSS